MRNIIILTAAIPRGELHKSSIGAFYKLFNNYLLEYNIHHVINIDNPDKLKDVYSREETKKLFDKIIPSRVNKHYIITDKPNFCRAYVNVIREIYEKKIIDKDSIIWWLEDDWKPKRNYNYTNLFRFLDFSNSAISLTSNTPLCSFRGGPVMSYDFFVKYFDIHKTINIRKDPEHKVRHNIRDYTVHNGDIAFIGVYLLPYFKKSIKIQQDHSRYYSDRWRNVKFNNGKFKKYMVLMDNVDSKEVYVYKYDKLELKSLVIEDLKKVFRLCRVEDFRKECESNSINYFNIIPHIFEDIGRVFNKKNSLIKKNNSYI